jgi:hypothetical protein
MDGRSAAEPLVRTDRIFAHSPKHGGGLPAADIKEGEVVGRGQGKGVTQAMMASGFFTKSNLNKEFGRVMRIAPTEWITTKSPKRPTSWG